MIISNEVTDMHSPVGMVVPAVWLHLDVFADDVHAHVLHCLDVKEQSFIRGCRVDAIWVEALQFPTISHSYKKMMSTITIQWTIST